MKTFSWIILIVCSFFLGITVCWIAIPPEIHQVKTYADYHDDGYIIVIGHKSDCQHIWEWNSATGVVRITYPNKVDADRLYNIISHLVKGH